VFTKAIGANVKLAEAPSFGQTIFQYAPESSGARDYLALAKEVVTREASMPRPASAETLVPAPRATAPGPTGTPAARPAVEQKPKPRAASAS
jgi:chromosome partitioning protein